MKLEKIEDSLATALKENTPDEQAECLRRLAATFGFAIRTWQNALTPEDRRAKLREYHRRRYATLTYGTKDIPDLYGLADLEVGDFVVMPGVHDGKVVNQTWRQWSKRCAPDRQFKIQPEWHPDPKKAGQTKYHIGYRLTRLV